MEPLVGRITAGALRAIAALMLFAGISVFVAGLPLSGWLIDSPTLNAIAYTILGIGGLFVVASATARFLLSPRLVRLPNELAVTPVGDRPELGGVFIALGIGFVIVPIWLLIRLQPFFAGWSQLIELLGMSGIWNNANANWSGIVLLPLAGALTPPLFELAAVVLIVALSASLLILLLLRSPRFPRLYLVFNVLLAALVVGSFLSGFAVLAVGESVQQFVDRSGTPAEAAELRDVLSQYTSIVDSTARVLVWTLCFYLVWVPAMFASRYAGVTFANRADANTARTDIAFITRPPSFGG